MSVQVRDRFRFILLLLEKREYRIGRRRKRESNVKFLGNNQRRRSFSLPEFLANGIVRVSGWNGAHPEQLHGFEHPRWCLE